MAEYSAESIQVIDGIEAVRKRPGMYIGDTTTGAGMRHLVWEIVGNAVDEHLAGRASTVRVSIEGWVVTVQDDGIGVPVDRAGDASCLQRVFTELHCGSRGKRPHNHVGESLTGVGCAVVTALSRRAEVRTTRAGRRYRQCYVKGRPTTEVEDLGPTDRVGTWVRFEPDLEVLAPTPWDLALLRRRLWDLACLTPGLAVVFNGESMRAPEGLAAWVRMHAQQPWLQSSVFRFDSHRDGVRVEVALAWTGSAGRVAGWANRFASEAGSHIDGLWSGLAWSLAPGVSAEAAREVLAPGLVAAVHVELVDPRFGDPCRDQLAAPEAAAEVARTLVAGLPKRLQSEPGLASLLRERIAR